MQPTTNAADDQLLKELVTLAMLTATATDERPSGEDTETHANRIARGIKQQLDNSLLSTAGDWSLVWLALSRSNDNLVYVAQKANAIAVSIRGTLFSNLNDVVEDFDVGTVVGLKVNDSAQTVGVSAGAMEAFSEVMNAVSTQSTILQYLGTNLMTVLQALVMAASSPPVVYVTGHSLGGAIATVVGLYLQAQTWGGVYAPSFQVYVCGADRGGQELRGRVSGGTPEHGPELRGADRQPSGCRAAGRSDLADVVKDFFPSSAPPWMPLRI